MGKEDHAAIFFPFKKSKLAWFRKIKVVLDHPMGQGGGSLLGLNVVGTLSVSPPPLNHIVIAHLYQLSIKDDLASTKIQKI